MNRKLNLANVILSVLIGLTLLFSAVQPVSVSASDSFIQDGIRRSYHPQTGKLSFLGADPSNPVRVEKAMERGLAPESRAVVNLEMYAREFGIRDASRELRVMRSTSAEDRLMVKYQQVYNDIPVMAGELIVNMKGNGGLLSINGEVSPDMSLDTQPKLSAEDARQRALGLISQTYDLAEAELTVSEPELWIFDERLIQNNATQPVHLVWRMEVSSENAPLRELVLVNAQSGKISLHFNQVDTSWTGNPSPAKEDAVNHEAVSAAEPIHAPATGLNMPLGDPDPSLNLFVASTGTDDTGNNACTDFANPCATINHAISQASDGQTIGVAEGTYTGSGTEVVSINKSVNLSGGWNPDFSIQTGRSIIDGENVRLGIVIPYIGGNPVLFYTVTVERFIVEHGNSISKGSGIDNFGNLTLSKSIIRYNESANSGAIRNFAAPIRIVESAIHNNVGSGLSFETNTTASPTVYVTNSTISNNTRLGIGVSSDVPAVINSTTISGNSYIGLSSGTSTNASVKIRNSIVASNNSTGGNSPRDCTGKITSLGYNIIENAQYCTISATAGDKFNVDPKLGTFISYYGYHPLQATSPAINNANSAACPDTDQRGVIRGAKCDIGAYEYTAPGTPANLLLVDGDNQHVGPNLEFNPFSVVVVDSSGSPVPGVGVSFIAPSSDPSGVFTITGTNNMSVITDAGGTAVSAPLKANIENGSFVVTANADLIGSVAFNLTIETWYVSSSGDDASDCRSPSTPCATLKGALQNIALPDRSVVWVTADIFEVTENGTAIHFFRDVNLIGGWNSTFTVQTGHTTAKGRFSIDEGSTVSIHRFEIVPSSVGSPQKPVAVNVYYGTLTISDSIIRDNGQGIGSWHGNVRVANSTIANNFGAVQQGGGIGVNGGTLTVINSTISKNGESTITWGGGVFSESATTTILSSTITGNAGYEAGGIYAVGTVNLANTLLIGNRAYRGTLYGPDCKGNIISKGNNIIGTLGKLSNGSYPCRGDWSSRTDLVGISTPIAVTKVLVSTLKQDPTSGQWYHPLKLGSPAIDGGNTALVGGSGNACPATDQLGVSRPQGVYCDIGAAEYQFNRYPTQSLLVTYSANNTISLPGVQVCAGNNGACGSLDDIHANKAHLFAYSTYLKYLTWHGRNSIDGNGFQINSTVHFNNNYQNAFWNGHMLVFGDGYGFPMADDVVAHEYTHGVTQYESNLFYWYQSGAINESFSDLWGEAVDQSIGFGTTDTNAVKWLIGEDVRGLGAIRNMANPPAFKHPDSMSSTYYCKSGDCLKDNGGVHTNSGVNNKAVYLLVNGGTFNSQTVTPLGWEKTLSIYYEAQTSLLTSGSDYLDLYSALYQACRNKVGSNGITSADCIAVQRATKAVKMNLQPVANFNPDIPYCPARTYRAIPDLVYDDFEMGTGNWTFNWLVGLPTPDSAWGHSGEYARSGRFSLWADDGYEQSDSYAAMKRAMLIPVGAKSFLHFSHSYGFDTDIYYYDGGVLEYTTNNGKTWLDAKSLFSAGQNYKGTLQANTGNPIGGRLAFVGDSHGFVDSRYDLSSLAGKRIRFRWRLGTDQSASVLGWYVDDVRVYTCVSIPSAPVLMLPANASTVASLAPSFDWKDSAPDLHYYQLQLATDSAFTLNMKTYNAIPVSAFSLTTELDSKTTYYWRVRAFNAAGKASAWSTVWSFTTP